MRRPTMPMRRRPLPQRSFIPQRGPIGPPRRQLPMTSSNFGGMPGLRPPKGIAEQLNRAKLKDFMQLGQFLMQRRRALQA
uniref:Uncharacterized protein n=1 Tax=Panagrolaimus superbus TaxID=310955 RepID=A0A914YI79_9BILA